MKLKKGDKVKVMTGKDRGKEGVVERVWQQERKATVSGANIFKRHLKPRGEGKTGGITDFIRPLPIANVSLVCPKCKQVTKVGYKVTDKEKVRICRKCDQEL